MLNNRMILLWIIVIFLFCSFNATFVFAKGGGKGHGSSGSHGWKQGKKKGWNTDVAPGIENKGEDWKPSGLIEGKEIQKENKNVEKRQEKEQEKDRNRERERHGEKKRKVKSSEE